MSLFFLFLFPLLISLCICDITDYFGQLTIHQKDTILTCSYIVGTQLDKDNLYIVNLSNSTGKEFEEVYNKLLFEMFEKCLDKVDNQTVHSTINNLIFLGLDWKDSMSDLVKLDYSNYTNESFALSMNQKLLARTFEVVNEEARLKQIEIDEEKRNHIHIGSFQVDNISPIVKLSIFIGFFGISGLVIYYMMSKVLKKKEKKKKKKNK